MKGNIVSQPHLLPEQIYPFDARGQIVIDFIRT